MGKIKKRSAWPEPECCGAVPCVAGAESVRKNRAARLGEAALSWTCFVWTIFCLDLRSELQESWRNLTGAQTLRLCSRKPMTRATQGGHTSCFWGGALSEAMQPDCGWTQSNAAVQTFSLAPQLLFFLCYHPELCMANNRFPVKSI